VNRKDELGVELGIEVSADLDTLIDHIVVGPAIPPDERDRVAELASGAGFKDRLRFSSLLGRPRYIKACSRTRARENRFRPSRDPTFGHAQYSPRDHVHAISSVDDAFAENACNNVTLRAAKTQ
jgi:hypothetical protein